MKKIFTLCVFIFVIIRLNAQVVFNEFYTDPSNGNHEYFEYYNTSATIENMDSYTLVSYYEAGGKTGFYVMDLPSLTVPAKGYFTGASASPFSIQGQSGLIASFNWNVMPAGGYIKKFERNGSNYTEVAVPANLNDFFVTRTGTGAAHHLFVFENGVLANGLFGATNFAVIPSYIKSMPPIFIDMSGTSTDFLINFNSFNDNQFEYVTPNAGNDNGYFRASDGKCGVWEKSSLASQHTPTVTNGSATGSSGGTITITSNITELSGDPSKSLLTYNISAGALAAFPLTVETYQDLGTIGQLDAADVLVDSRLINTISSDDQYVIMPTHDDPVMIAAKTPSGCFDRVISVANNLAVAAATLPVYLIRFQGNMNKSNKVTLNWTAANNETVDHFEVERSVNGKDFTTAAIVFATEKMDTEDYFYFETINSNDKVMFRLKMFDKGQDVDYSRILVFQPKSNNSTQLKVYGNPVNDKLTFSYTSTAAQSADVRVYDMSGRIILSQKVNSLEGSNMMSLPLSSTFKTGMYVVEVNNGIDRQTAKFIKQ